MPENKHSTFSKSCPKSASVKQHRLTDSADYLQGHLNAEVSLKQCSEGGDNRGADTGPIFALLSLPRQQAGDGSAGHFSHFMNAATRPRSTCRPRAKPRKAGNWECSNYKVSWTNIAAFPKTYQRNEGLFPTLVETWRSKDQEGKLTMSP